MNRIDLILEKLQARETNILDYEMYGKYAITLPLVLKDEQWHILFEVRSNRLKHQPGEICFPGGKVEKEDMSIKDAAIRETCEELGINQSSITSIAAIDYFVSPYGKIIYPFVIKIKENTIFHINEEVHEIFFVPLAYLESYQVEEFKIELKVEPEVDFPYDKIVGGKDYQWQKRKASEYFYKYGDKNIWGLTARVLRHFLQLNKQIKS